jgi:myo-inositol catabolism protein IolS
MEKTTLSSTNIEIPRIGFGCCPLGGYGWGEMDPVEVQNAVKLAIETGVMLFDTADVYGMGQSEILLGKCIKEVGIRPVVATKFGVRKDNSDVTFYDNSPEWIDKALDGSLKRLGVDCIDIYQIHYRDKKIPFLDVLEHISEKISVGKIKYFGLSNCTDDEIVAARRVLNDSVVCFQKEFSLAKAEEKEKIKSISENTKLNFFSWGSLGQGILSGKYTSRSEFGNDDRRSRPVYTNFSEVKIHDNLKLVEIARDLANIYSCSVSAISLRWVLESIPNSVAIVGIKSRAQLSANLQSLNIRFSDEHLALITGFVNARSS